SPRVVAEIRSRFTMVCTDLAMNVRHVTILLAVAFTAAGCFSRDPINIKSDDPGAKIPAIKQAGEAKDREAVAELVKGLDSDDPAVRFYAMEALGRITGQKFGYEYYFDEDQRKPSLQRWQRWLTEQNGGSGATAATTAPTTTSSAIAGE